MDCCDREFKLSICLLFILVIMPLSVALFKVINFKLEEEVNQVSTAKVGQTLPLTNIIADKETAVDYWKTDEDDDDDDYDIRPSVGKNISLFYPTRNNPLSSTSKPTKPALVLKNATGLNFTTEFGKINISKDNFNKYVTLLLYVFLIAVGFFLIIRAIRSYARENGLTFGIVRESIRRSRLDAAAHQGSDAPLCIELDEMNDNTDRASNS